MRLSMRVFLASYCARAAARSPCCSRTSPDALVANGKVELESGIAGIGDGQALDDSEALAVDPQRIGKLALCQEYIANFGIGNREVALIDLVVRLFGGQSG